MLIFSFAVSNPFLASPKCISVQVIILQDSTTFVLTWKADEGFTTLSFIYNIYKQQIGVHKQTILLICRFLHLTIYQIKDF